MLLTAVIALGLIGFGVFLFLKFGLEPGPIVAAKAPVTPRARTQNIPVTKKSPASNIRKDAPPKTSAHPSAYPAHPPRNPLLALSARAPHAAHPAIEPTSVLPTIGV